MQDVMNGYRGLQLLVVLNRDRLFSLAVILLALQAGVLVMDALAPSLDTLPPG